jgi:hypothetical protein
MTDRLRELFDELVAGEPPLRTTSDDTARAGRRLHARRVRTMWTVTGAAVAVLLVAVLPFLPGQQGTGEPIEASPSAVMLSSASVIASTPLPMETNRYCPTRTVPVKVNESNAAVLPDPRAAAAVVTEAAPRIAPGKQFILRYAGIRPASGQSARLPMAEIIFDVGDSRGFGSVTVEIRPETGATPTVRAQMNLNRLSDCIQIERRVFSDGSVAVSYPVGSPRPTTEVWYFGAGGYTMNITTTPQGWAFASGTGGSLPVRTDQPLTPAQVAEVADVIAHSGPSVAYATPRVAAS